MKKLPVLLLILTLASVMPMNVASALGTGEEQGADAEVGERVATELPVVHELDERMHIQKISPREGSIEIEVVNPMGEELQAQRIWFATMDYESGWTEAEVDELLDDWTTLEAEWTKVTKEYPFVNALPHFYRTITLTIGETRAHYDLTVVNLPDVLYYATEFKDLANEEAGTFWVRGKVDYRGCVHAQRFREGQTGACVEKADWSAGTVKYWAAESTEDEEVITWEEEWRQVLAGRINEVGAVLDGLVMVPDLPKEALAQSLAYEETKLVRVEALLAKATGVEEEVAEVARLRARMAKMLNGPAEGTGNGTSGGSGSLNTSGSGTSNVVGSGSSNGSEVGTGDEPGASEEETGSGSDVGPSDGSGSVDFVGDLGSPDFGGVVSSSDSAVGDSGESAGEIVESADGSEEATEVKAVDPEIEVPKLGGAKADRGGWIWWVIGISGALALFLVAVLKRKQRK